jgi:hypothetical protein
MCEQQMLATSFFVIFLLDCELCRCFVLRACSCFRLENGSIDCDLTCVQSWVMFVSVTCPHCACCTLVAQVVVHWCMFVCI